jgi:hypothetical protein
MGNNNFMKDIIWREFFLLDLKGKIMLPANW